MRWQLVGLAVLVGTTAVRADLPPRPPEPLPKGKKFVSLHNLIILDKGVSGYAFFTDNWEGPGAPRHNYSAARVTSDIEYEHSPITGRYRGSSFFAVPEEEVKKYKTDAELHAALGKQAVPGVQSMTFRTEKLVEQEDTRSPIFLRYTITAIGKDGIKSTAKEVDEPAPISLPPIPLPGSAPPPKMESPTAGLRLACAGTALALAVVAGGVWVVRRR